MRVDFNGDKPRQSVVEGTCADPRRIKQAMGKLKQIMFAPEF
jgi:hypothetical protein